MDVLVNLLWSGWLSLLDYLAAHVLLCLLPAFIIAGYISARVPKEIVTQYLGPQAKKWISYPAAALGGFILAVCSCTILPLFAGIWRRGAGLGTAITFLFVGPAVNILAIAYTGAAIGLDIALARIILSIFFGIGIGLIMAWFFRAEERERIQSLAESGMFDRRAALEPSVWVPFLLLFGVLIVGTLQINPLTNIWIQFEIPIHLPGWMMTMLEGANLDVQGVLLIALLILIAPVAYLGLDKILVQFNRWTYITMVLTVLTLLVATPVMASGSLQLGLTGRFFGEVILIATIGYTIRRSFTQDEIAEWLWETWKFVKQIFPLLIAGVFIAGMVKVVLPEQWVQSLAGRNTIWANVIGVVFGVFMYFPTLVEVPVARMFLDLGMHRGPLLAYLLADPALSLQSILVTGRIVGRKKTAAYVVLVSIFSSLAGYLFGLFMTLA